MSLKSKIYQFNRYLIFLSLFIVLSTLIFLTFLNSELLNNFNFLFFRAMALLLLSITVTAFFFNGIKIGFSLKDLVLFSVLSFTLNWFVYGLIPFNVSRSNSVILIGYLNSKSGIPVSKTQVQKVLHQIYFEKYDAIEVRLNEQIFNGAVIRTEQGYEITPLGQLQVKILNKISDLYGVKQNFLSLDLYEDIDD